ncbi:hypothetical protein VIGAN_09219400, partial [Vigna angularis var. angularis]
SSRTKLETCRFVGPLQFIEALSQTDKMQKINETFQMYTLPFNLIMLPQTVTLILFENMHSSMFQNIKDTHHDVILLMFAILKIEK